MESLHLQSIKKVKRKKPYVYYKSVYLVEMLRGFTAKIVRQASSEQQEIEIAV
jgi:hypothetical protein